MAKPKVKEVIVVEGRYDKNTLSQAVDAAIVEVGGFAVFNDKEKQAFLRKLAKERGIILFTDPDGAGFVIRNRVKGNISPRVVCCKPTYRTSTARRSASARAARRASSASRA